MIQITIARLTACTGALALAAFGGGPAPAKTIGTLASWDGSSYVQSFGCPDTTTYGQVITVPEGQHTLNKFFFEWTPLDKGSMVMRGEVYAWDGTKATGSALWESAPERIHFSNRHYYKVIFTPGTVAVMPGAQYVLFASIDKDFEQCRNYYGLAWGFVPDGNAYPGGNFVFQNNAGDEARWTTMPWGTSGSDSAFKASFSH